MASTVIEELVIAINHKVKGKGLEKAAKDVDSLGKKVEKTDRKVRRGKKGVEELGDEAEDTGKKAKQGSDGVEKLGDESEKAGRKAERAGHKLQKMSGKGVMGGIKATTIAMGTLAARAIQFGASLGVGVATNLVKTGAEFERLKTSLVTVTGSTEEADKAFNQITKFAKETPYSVQDITSAFIKLKALGLDASESSLRSYGNTASAMGKSLNDMIEAVADASTGEFERLKEFGIKASSHGDKVRFTFQGVTTEVRKNAHEIESYLQSIGNVQFAGGMERQSKTLQGIWSNFTDSLEILSSKIFESGLGDALKDILGRVNTSLVGVGDIGETIGPILADVIEGAVELVDFIWEGGTKIWEAIEPVMIALGKFAMELLPMIKVKGMAVIDALVGAWNSLDRVVAKFFGQSENGLGRLVSLIGEFVHGALKDAFEFVERFLISLEEHFNRLAEVIQLFKDGRIVDGFKKIGEMILEMVLEPIREVARQIIALADGLGVGGRVPASLRKFAGGGSEKIRKDREDMENADQALAGAQASRAEHQNELMRQAEKRAQDINLRRLEQELSSPQKYLNKKGRVRTAKKPSKDLVKAQLAAGQKAIEEGLPYDIAIQRAREASATHAVGKIVKGGFKTGGGKGKGKKEKKDMSEFEKKAESFIESRAKQAGLLAGQRAIAQGLGLQEASRLAKEAEAAEKTRLHALADKGGLETDPAFVRDQLIKSVENQVGRSSAPPIIINNNQQKVHVDAPITVNGSFNASVKQVGDELERRIKDVFTREVIIGIDAFQGQQVR